MPLLPHPLLRLLIASALLVGVMSAWPSHAQAQTVKRCNDASGAVIYTDKPCQAIGAAERRPATAYRQAGNYVYRGGCARNLDDLVYQVSTAIDTRDPGRLSTVYHWTGLDSETGYAVMARLMRLAERPLHDITLTGGGGGEPKWVEDAEGNLVPVMPKRGPATGLRIEQGSKDGVATSRTQFALRQNLGCWWIQFAQ